MDVDRLRGRQSRRCPGLSHPVRQTRKSTSHCLDACERCAQSAAWKDCCDEFKFAPGTGVTNIYAFSRLVRFSLTVWIVSTLSVRRFDTL